MVKNGGNKEGETFFAEATEDKLVEPVLGDSTDSISADRKAEDVNTERVVQSDGAKEEVIGQDDKVSESTTAPQEDDLDIRLNKNQEKKERLEVDPRVRKLDEVMDDAGLISDFEEGRAVGVMINDEGGGLEKEVLLDKMEEEINRNT